MLKRLHVGGRVRLLCVALSILALGACENATEPPDDPGSTPDILDVMDVIDATIGRLTGAATANPTVTITAPENESLFHVGSDGASVTLEVQLGDGISSGEYGLLYSLNGVSMEYNSSFMSNIT